MTRESFDRAYVAIDRIAKLKAIKEKITREFPEFGYDKESKVIGEAIFQVIDAKLQEEQSEFEKL